MADRDPSTRTERRAAAAALAAELGHELQGPLNVFRLSRDRLLRGATLDAEDLSLLGEELERLSRMSARLRELARTPSRKLASTPRALVALALAQRPLSAALEVEVTDQLTLACDPTSVSQALRELIDNALEARVERAGVRFEASDGPGFCVWDDGPGFELSTNAAPHFGVTTRQGAPGLGLAIAARTARAHGFSLQLGRVASHTEAWLRVPVGQLQARAAP